ncbi:hypothetical protein TNCV_4941251 [Trichonephila clavipes]|nr:hypothetical protein TNCV_4941251 [Trichonephila clavipes]
MTHKAERNTLCVRRLYADLDKSEGGLLTVNGQDQQKILFFYGFPAVSFDHLLKFKELCNEAISVYHLNLQKGNHLRVLCGESKPIHLINVTYQPDE